MNILDDIIPKIIKYIRYDQTYINLISTNKYFGKYITYRKLKNMYHISQIWHIIYKYVFTFIYYDFPDSKYLLALPSSIRSLQFDKHFIDVIDNAFYLPKLKNIYLPDTYINHNSMLNVPIHFREQIITDIISNILYNSNNYCDQIEIHALHILKLIRVNNHAQLIRILNMFNRVHINWVSLFDASDYHNLYQNVVFGNMMTLPHIKYYLKLCLIVSHKVKSKSIVCHCIRKIDANLDVRCFLCAIKYLRWKIIRSLADI